MFLSFVTLSLVFCLKTVFGDDNSLCSPDEANKKVLHFVSREDWNALPPLKNETLSLPVDKIIIGHTAMESNKMLCNRESCDTHLQLIQEGHQGKGSFDIQYSFVFCGKAIYEGRGWNSVPSMVGKENQSIQIAFAGNYLNDHPLKVSIDALSAFVEFGKMKNKFVDSVTLHPACEFTSTRSPEHNLLKVLMGFEKFEVDKDSDCFPLRKINKILSAIYIISGIIAVAIALIIGLYFTHNWWIQKIRPCYRMKSAPRGLCLIVANSHFRDDLQSEVDTKQLKAAFESLKYECQLKSNLAASEMLEVFSAASRDRLLMASDSFVCIISTLGDKHDRLFGTDAKSLTLHSILKYFNDDSCIFLRKKPKMFFIITEQAENNLSSEEFGNERFKPTWKQKREFDYEYYKSCESKEDGPSWQDMIILQTDCKSVEEVRLVIALLADCIQNYAKTTHLEKILQIFSKQLITKSKIDSSIESAIVTPFVKNRGFTKYLYFHSK